MIIDWDKVRCFFGRHKFDKSVIKSRSGSLEVRECIRCGKYLNIHHLINHNYVSKSDKGIKEDIVLINMINDKIDKMLKEE